MSFHFEVSQGLRVDNLPALQDKVRLRGGRLVVYAEVISAFVISIRSYRVRWIATAEERSMGGMFSSALTTLLGWWAFIGPYHSIAALVWNGRGGIDITDALLRADPRNTSLLEYSDAVRFSDFEESGRRIAMRIFWGAVLLLIAAFVYRIWSVWNK